MFTDYYNGDQMFYAQEVDFIKQYLEIPMLTVSGKSLNGRCVVCGDSEKHLHKKRFYIYKGYDDNAMCTCMNCNYNEPLGKFIKSYFPNKYQSYKLMDLMPINENLRVPEPEQVLDLSILEKLDTLLACIKPVEYEDPNHPARWYLEQKRHLPIAGRGLKYVPNFADFCDQIKTINPGFVDFNYSQLKFPAVLMVLRDLDQRVTHIQARNLMANSKYDIRFITIKINDAKPKIWGLDRIDLTKQVYIFEGVFDALYMPNSIAMLGGKISNVDKILDIDRKQITFVYDNEYGVNPQITDNYDEMANDGYKIFVWDRNCPYNDINDLAIKHPEIDIPELIENRSFIGFKAQVVLKFR